MHLRQSLYHACASSREPQAHDPPVVGVVDAADKARFLGAVDELHGAVVAQQQRVGEITDGRPAIAAVAAHREKQLVLRRGDPRRDGLRLAPVQELAQRGAELQQALIVAVS